MNYKTNLSTTQKRNQLKGQLDSFATFKWRGEDAFEKCGCFIINEKSGSLKFYNGGGFSNEYSKPMFSASNGNLLGISTKMQPITFKVGLYWFSIEEYQEFLDWINPYNISYLSFGYEEDYGYLVKLNKIADSPRHIVGYENSEPRYYTEMDLSWDVQGESFVRSNNPYEWKLDDASTTNNWTYIRDLKEGTVTFDGVDTSLLDTPLYATIPFWPKNNETSISLSFLYDDKKEQLFNVEFQNLTWFQNIANWKIITNNFNSSLYYKLGVNIDNQDYFITDEIVNNEIITTTEATTSLNLELEIIYHMGDSYSFYIFTRTEHQKKYLNLQWDIYENISLEWGNDKKTIWKFSLPEKQITTTGGSGSIIAFNLIKSENSNNISIQIIRNVSDVSVSSVFFYTQEFSNFSFSNTPIDNLYLDTQDQGLYNYTISYDSETGLLFLTNGDKRLLINYLTSVDGENIVKSVDAKRWKMPGKFSVPDIDYKIIKFQLEIKNGDFITTTLVDDEVVNASDQVQLLMYGRKNIV